MIVLSDCLTNKIDEGCLKVANSLTKRLKKADASTMVESIDYLDFKNKVKGDYSVIQGHSFWDVLSEEGKKVFIFNPFMAYPAWNVNGLMICGPVFEGGDVSTNRPDLVDMKTISEESV